MREWIIDFEYNYHGIPRPDINVFLDVPFEFTTRKLSSARNGDDRDYLNGKPDIHEQDLDFQRKVRKVYLIGKAAEMMAEAWTDVVDCCMCSELENAVRTAWSDVAPGETVLLSPGCASFDQFKNFEDRGTQFERIVTLLAEEK